jgi:4-hydroxythreonine-4-phosphate dehydrogenase
MNKNIGLTMGDPSGIGPEISVKVLNKNSEGIKVYGDLGILKETANKLNLSLNESNIVHVEAKKFPKNSLINGKPTVCSGEMSYKIVERAAQDCLQKKISAMITGPISKYAWQLAGYNWPGHTELLAYLSNPTNPPKIRMLLKSPTLSIVLNSTHLSLRSAIEGLNCNNLLETIIISDQWFESYLKKKPKLLLAALNPHAGESKTLGNEEVDILEPTICEAIKRGVSISGPWPADTVFLKATQNKKFDAVISLYHDQALIPFKLNGLENGVNTTIGLPFLRVSVDHGTAFDIAGQNKASELPLLTAIRATKEMIKNENNF